jgi:hypothetical protein
MSNLADYPLAVFVLSLLVLWLSTRIGVFLLRKHHSLKKEIREDFSVIQAATLTLLGLIIGFSFSMAVNRYDQRKNFEEAEANAIGTEYARADLLPARDAAKVRALLKDYAEQRIEFYKAREEKEVPEINERTARLQNELWSAVTGPAKANPNSMMMSLVVSGMNDVLNSQGYTQAAWWNRIPTAAWVLMVAMAVCSNILIGYGAQNSEQEGVLLAILPIVVSVAFLLISDIDSPRRGLIHVSPQNLNAAVESLRAP